jgi:iron-sulfur cluster assembly protein
MEKRMTIKLTPNAAQHILKKLEERQNSFGLRLGVRSSGCSGFAYTLEFADHIDEFDLEFKDKNVRIFVSKKYIDLLNGITLDYGKEGLNEGFKFINPNEKNQCGCGESFSV